MAFRMSSSTGRVMGQYETFHEAVQAAREDNAGTDRQIVIEDIGDGSREALVAAKMTAPGSLLIKKEYLASAMGLKP